MATKKRPAKRAPVAKAPKAADNARQFPASSPHPETERNPEALKHWGR